MKSTVTEGIVLKTRNYREADKILTIFSRKEGKLVVLAKGLRRISSKRAGTLDVLNLVRMGLADSRAMQVVTETSLLDSFKAVKRNLENLKLGYVIVELLDKLTSFGEENIKIFELAVTSLHNIGRLKDGGRRLALTFFEYKLLYLLGYDPVLDFCTVCYSDILDTWSSIKFSAVTGGIICPNCNKGGILIDLETVSLMRSLRDLSFNDIQNNGVMREELKKAEEVILYFTEYILEGKIKSQKVFEKVLNS